MTCDWIGDGEGCSNPALPGKSYCEQHIHMIYQEGTALAKRKKDIRTVDNVRWLSTLMDEAISELEDEGYL